MESPKVPKMRIFQSVQKNLALIGYSSDQHPFNNQQLFFSCMMLWSIMTIFSYIFCIADSQKESIVALFMAVACILISISFLSTVLKIKTIFLLINKAEKLVNKRLVHPVARPMYERTNQQAENYSKIIYFLIVYVSAPSFVLPKAMLSYFLYFTTDLGFEAFEMPIPQWQPFDWKTPFGYFIAVTLQLISAFLALRYIGCFLSFALTGFLFALSLAKDFKNHFKLVDAHTKAKSPETVVFRQITEWIRFSNMNRLLNYFSEIYDITLTLIFVGCTVTIAVALLMIQQELVQTDFTQFHLIIVHRIDYTFIVLFRTLRRQISDEIDSVMLFEAILCGFWSILVVFVACEFGQRFSDALDSCDDKLAQLDWYLVPRRIQRMLPMIILNSQQPMIVQCFGNVPCGRETFKKVVNTAYSYFMILLRSF